jgi:hypothetical protein
MEERRKQVRRRQVGATNDRLKSLKLSGVEKLKGDILLLGVGHFSLSLRCKPKRETFCGNPK